MLDILIFGSVPSMLFLKPIILCLLLFFSISGEASKFSAGDQKVDLALMSNSELSEFTIKFLINNLIEMAKPQKIRNVRLNALAYLYNNNGNKSFSWLEEHLRFFLESGSTENQQKKGIFASQLYNKLYYTGHRWNEFAARYSIKEKSGIEFLHNFLVNSFKPSNQDSHQTVASTMEALLLGAYEQYIHSTPKNNGLYIAAIELLTNQTACTAHMKYVIPLAQVHLNSEQQENKGHCQCNGRPYEKASYSSSMPSAKTGISLGLLWAYVLGIKACNAISVCYEMDDKGYRAYQDHLGNEIARCDKDKTELASDFSICSENLNLAQQNFTDENKSCFHDLSTANVDLKNCHTMATNLNTSLTNAHDNLNATGSALSGAYTTLNTTQTELAAAHSALNTTQSDLAAAHSALNTTQSALTHAYSALNTTQSELIGCNAQLNTTGSKIVYCQKNVTSLTHLYEMQAIENKRLISQNQQVTEWLAASETSKWLYAGITGIVSAAVTLGVTTLACWLNGKYKCCPSCRAKNIKRARNSDEEANAATPLNSTPS